MLSYFRIYIKFPEDKPIPLKLISEVALELDIDPSIISDFDWRSRTCERYRQEIRNYLGYRTGNNDDIKAFTEHLIKNILPHNPSGDLLMEQTRLFFYQNKVELFKRKMLERYITSSKHQFEQVFFQEVFASLTKADCYLIDQILEQTEQSKDYVSGDILTLSELKRDIPGAKLKNVDLALDKIALLGKITLPELVVNSVSRKLLLKYYDRIMALSPSNILEFSPTAKYANMAIFFHI